VDFDKLGNLILIAHSEYVEVIFGLILKTCL